MSLLNHLHVSVDPVRDKKFVDGRLHDRRVLQTSVGSFLTQTDVARVPRRGCDNAPCLRLGEIIIVWVPTHKQPDVRKLAEPLAFNLILNN